MVRSVLLATQGIETLADLARYAVDFGLDEAIRLLSEACSRTRE